MEKWKDNRTIKIGKNGISKEDVLVTIFSFILLSSSFFFQEVHSDGFNFEDISNLSDTDSGFSTNQQISTVGSNVYVVWQDDTPGMFDIFFSRSTNSGESFDSFINLSESDVISENPQIAAVDSNVYVVWQEEAVDGADIFFRVSPDNGETFSEPVSLSTTDSGFSEFPQIAAVDSNVYVIWQEAAADGADIFFSRSINNGETFGVPVPLAPTDFGFSTNPQIATVGSNVYVVWQDYDTGVLDIFVSRSTDSGASFDSFINLSDSDVLSEFPQIAAVDSNVYVVWQEETLGQYEILYSPSSDSGINFDDPDNKSNNDGMSLFPQLERSGQNIYVVWQDDTPGQNEVFFRASLDEGTSFSTIFQVSDDDDNSVMPKIAVLGTDCHIVWEDSSLGITDIFYRHCIEVPTEIKFDFSSYKLGDTAKITIIDPSLKDLGFINADVSTTSGGSILLFELTESDTVPGEFTGQLTFTSGDSTSTAVHAKAGDFITVTLGEISNSASIFPIIVEFENLPSYSLSKSALITVTDQNANKDIDAVEEISITITSTTDSFGIPLTLKETGPDSGMFENKKLIFMEGDDRFQINSNIKISQEETVGGLDSNNIVDTITVEITSTDPVGVVPVEVIQFFTLTETGPNTGFFEGTFTISSGLTSSNAIHAKEGNIVGVTYLGETANSLVISNPNGNVGAIQAAIGDIIAASYSEESDDILISPGTGGGRGGGGFIRPGLVLNVIAGIFGGGNGGANSPPSFGASSFATITGGEEGFGGILNDNDVNTLEQTKTFKVGEKAVLRFDFTQGGGIGSIEHIGLYTNIRDGQKKYASDAYIYYDPLKSPKLTVHDPNRFFSEAKFDLLQKDVTHFVLKFDLTFAKPMPKSDIILESWNTQKWSSLNKIPNAIEVISSGIVQETTSEPMVETFVEDVTNDQVIPVWVKSNAKWWSEDEIDNDNFISGIEYLVNEGIIKVSVIETGDTSISEIPSWIKNNAGWWADDMISDDEFVRGIEWLVKNRIIIV